MLIGHTAHGLELVTHWLICLPLCQCTYFCYMHDWIRLNIWSKEVVEWDVHEKFSVGPSSYQVTSHVSHGSLEGMHHRFCYSHGSTSHFHSRNYKTAAYNANSSATSLASPLLFFVCQDKTRRVISSDWQKSEERPPIWIRNCRDFPKHTNRTVGTRLTLNNTHRTLCKSQSKLLL